MILLLYGIHQPILMYLNKIENYKSINIFRMLQVLITAVSTVLLAMYNIKYSIIIGFFLGLLVATFYVLSFVSLHFSLSLLRQKIVKFDQFPKFGTWSSLLNNISKNSIPILLINFFSPIWVGYYSYATRLLNAPTGMYINALSQVYYKTASDADNSTLKIQTRKWIRFSFFLAMVPSLILLFFGENIFQWLFKDEWIAAGKVTQYLVMWYFTGVITGPVSFILDVKQKLKWELKYNIIIFLLRMVAIMIGGLLQDFYLSVLLFSLVGIVMNGYLYYYIEWKLLQRD